MTETLSVRMDSELKKDFNTVCENLGVSMSTLVTMLAKNVTRYHRIPEDLCEYDPFYSEANMNHLRKIWDDMQTGKAHFAEHELIEADDE